MVTDDDVLEKEDMHIYDRIKAFISTEEVARFPAAKQVMTLLDRGVSGPLILSILSPIKFAEGSKAHSTASTPSAHFSETIQEAQAIGH